jgi:hypothetical protein
MATYKVVIQGRALEVNADSEQQAKREAVRHCVYAECVGIGDEWDCERFEHELWRSIVEVARKDLALW